MRPAPDKVAIILDHSGNSGCHGFPDDDREWSLDGRQGGTRAANDNAPPPPVTCEGCFRQIRRPIPMHCPSCGKLLLREVKPEEFEAKDEDLVLAKRNAKAEEIAQRKREEGACCTMDDWLALARKRGYDFPTQWAEKRYALRHRRTA